MDMSAYVTAPLQLYKICRACLTERSDMKPLYGSCLDKMLNSFTSIQVKQDDGLPSLMCVQCVRQCNRAYSFKQQCEKSDRILAEFIKTKYMSQLQEPVMPIDFKIEVDDSSELDQYAEVAHKPIKDEIVPEFDTCTDSEPKPDQKTIESDELAEVPNGFISNEINHALLIDSKVKSEKVTIKQADKNKQPQLIVRIDRDAILPSKAELKAPRKTNLKERTHVCTICSKAFIDSYHLNRHTNIHLVKKPYNCDQCDKTFADSANLAKHKKKHTGEKLLGCNFCSRQFVEAEKLQIHIRSHTVKRPYSCDACDKTFTQVSKLNRHVLVHTGEKPYRCSICGKGFPQAGYVKIHMRTHTCVKPNVCQTCGKAFLTLNSLAVHKRVHLGKRPYKCKTCGRCFTTHQSLIVHTRTHTGIKSHFCDICEKGFNHSGHLSMHKRKHGGENSCVCNVCGMKFVNVSRVGIHMKSHLVEKEGQEDIKSCKRMDEALVLDDKIEPLKRNPIRSSRR